MITIRDKSIRRVLHQLLRQTREHQIVYHDDQIVIDGIPADVLLTLGLSVLYQLGWIMPNKGQYVLTGSGTTAVTDWDQRHEPTTDITRTEQMDTELWNALWAIQQTTDTEDPT